MNATEVKTRHGLILQGAVKSALSSARLTFRENWQYNPDYERPDFTIPDNETPTFALEVHQTDARSSFRMKILRSFNAVTEAKIFFGGSLISVNVLFGDPNTEIPSSNFRALCGYFDVNLVPRNDAPDQGVFSELESSALLLASNENFSVAGAVAHLIGAKQEEMAALSSLLRGALQQRFVKRTLVPLWEAEQRRVAAIGAPPQVGETTHVKRGTMQSLFLSNEQFAELQEKRDPNRCSPTLQEQLILTTLAEKSQSIKGDILTLTPIFRRFLADIRAQEFRALSERRIDEDPRMWWFFEDIRDSERRLNMVQEFLSSIQNGTLRDDLAGNLQSNEWRGIEHRRGWYIDLCALSLGIGMHEMSRRLYAAYSNPGGYADPISHLVLKTERFRASPNSQVDIYAENITDVFYSFARQRSVSLESINPRTLALKLLRLRMDGASKLQKLNPLYLLLENTARKCGLEATYKGHQSFLYDLSGAAGQLGKSSLYSLTDGRREVLANSLYIGEGYGSDHKADEWAARRRSLGYRFADGQVQPLHRAGYVFVVDGVWTDKSIRKLHTAGWDNICRPSELEGVLEGLFI